MKKDIICYIVLILSIVLFVYTNVFLKPIPLKEDQEATELIPIGQNGREPVFYGLEKQDVVENAYTGEVYLKDIWVDYTFLYTMHSEEFIKNYEKYNNMETCEEKAAYEKDVYLKYGINAQEERDSLYKAFKGLSEIIELSVIDYTVGTVENGIGFDTKVVDIEGKEVIFNTVIYNNYLDDGAYLKLLPKEI